MNNSSFKKALHGLTALFGAAAPLLWLLWALFGLPWLLSAAITATTACYHFAMRLAVGYTVPRLIKEPCTSSLFRQRSFEPRLYEKLQVKRWKDHMPTYDPASFSLRHNTPAQIIHNSCVSEAVHGVIILLSAVPLLFALFWGAFPVFFITSFLAAAFDGCFVIMQRYNRPRLQRILKKKEAKGL